VERTDGDIEAVFERILAITIVPRVGHGGEDEGVSCGREMYRGTPSALISSSLGSCAVAVRGRMLAM
jgi:hypothetical protein